MKEFIISIRDSLAFSALIFGVCVIIAADAFSSNLSKSINNVSSSVEQAGRYMHTTDTIKLEHSGVGEPLPIGRKHPVKIEIIEEK
ncbi:hypothetical protein [Sulfuriroseicoccus oceanibius]|uniref:Uncharacterized protein n=1 Tax=Sulfuriroseicoccus oceanibius TaxID=2707525 RepID=A0A6B3L0E3_9BACT|nr:hypothetical protein [Sulfuriroseicoccus oceanibius]QQL43842.1 hypothetical protein G3M56_008015 [Sulfuriroseicoccus oceanibius]